MPGMGGGGMPGMGGMGGGGGMPGMPGMGGGGGMPGMPGGMDMAKMQGKHLLEVLVTVF